MRKVVVSSALVFMLVLACVPGWAQGTAQISGTVTDNSGGALAGATVTATQTDTGVARSTTSNEAGVYVLPDLPIGPYRLEAAAKGFRTFVQTGIILEVQASAAINPRLQVGEVAQTVQVTENAPLVETERQGVVGEIVENQRILDLPLNGRNVNDLMTLSAGTTPVLIANVPTGSRDSFNQALNLVGIAGGVSYGVAYTLDGATHNNVFDGLSLSVPFPDALQEFKIETSAIGANSGGIHSAGLVSLATKSGTNQLHGDLFEFVRNYNFNARNAFATGLDYLKRNQFGGTIGGPIRKDKLFFFAGYQGTLISQNNPDVLGIVPTATMLAGNWTAFTSPACNGGRQITLKAPFVNNMINPSLYSPAALKFASMLPQTSNPCGDVTYANPIDEKEHQGIGKIDYHLSEKQSIFARYLVDNLSDPPPYQLDHNLLSANVYNGFGRNQALTLSDTYVLGANLVNVARLTINRFFDERGSDDTFSACSIGINTYCGLGGPGTAGLANGYPGWQNSIRFAVTGGIGSGANGGPTTDNNYAISDDVSWTHGNHQIAFGAAVEYWIAKWSGCTYCQPNFTFNGQITGTGYSDLLTGNVFQMVAGGSNDYLAHYGWYVGPFVNDTWKVSRRLTATLGLRWEPAFPLVPWDGRSYNISIPAILEGVKSQTYVNAPPGFTVPGDSGYPTPGKSEEFSRLGNVMPRVGLAWDVRGDGRTSVRASFGTFYDDVPEGFHIGDNSVWPFQTRVTLQNVKLDNPWAGYPGGDPFPILKGPDAALPTYQQFMVRPTNPYSPEVTQWNLSVQKQLKTNWLVSASYLGSNSIHLWMQGQLNPAVYLGLGSCTLNGVLYNPCSTTANSNQRRVLSLKDPSVGQDFSYLSDIDESGTANYNGLIITGQHRLSRGITVTANYTWSHCISDPITATINPTSSAYTVPGDPRADRGNCTIGAADIRHVFSLTSVLQTPKFSNRTLRMLGTGWSLAPILKIQSGDHLTPITSTDVALNGTANQRVSQVLSNPYGSGLQFLNPAAFALPATGTFSNVESGSIQGPSYWNLDVALSRDFNIGKEGARRIQARVESFNVTNSFRAADPVVNFSSSTFGQITSAYDPRIMQFALKFFY